MGNTMTPDTIRQARQQLGLSVQQFADLLDTDAQTVRRWQMGKTASTCRDLPPRAQRLITAYLDGYRPSDWPVAAVCTTRIVDRSGPRALPK